MTKFQLITKGLVKDNPTFVLLLGMCPTLATTTSAINGLSMGLATLFVLVLSNMVISAIAGQEHTNAHQRQTNSRLCLTLPGKDRPHCPAQQRNNSKIYKPIPNHVLLSSCLDVHWS